MSRGEKVAKKALANSDRSSSSSSSRTKTKRDWRIAHTQNKWNQRETRTSIWLLKLCTSHHVCVCVMCDARKREHSPNRRSARKSKMPHRYTKTLTCHPEYGESIRNFLFSWHPEKYDEIDDRMRTSETEKANNSQYVFSFTLWNYYLIIIFLGIFMWREREFLLRSKIHTYTQQSKKWETLCAVHSSLKPFSEWSKRWQKSVRRQANRVDAMP